MSKSTADPRNAHATDPTLPDGTGTDGAGRGSPCRGWPRRPPSPPCVHCTDPHSFSDLALGAGKGEPATMVAIRGERCPQRLWAFVER